ncbi:hypothetical protein D9V61_02960 [Buchnera aphidicola (Acyrthosiphon lactucae)]|uniref:Uncharacterized protein n=1 Tax=Buchnera aphidicola (Acyrthosiphon lactucae) TaxID=1241832 RepID=A0A4D6XMG7_9GAMM|nr:hypothetical protein [Buchnera aphidicola]QCI17953.1 hypothetical protein D9V61_02960 [Buchnera aphidicola (Acyrthosiphon lactucae)]
MLYNFLSSIDIANNKHSNKIDIYEETIKKILKIKKNTNKFKESNINNKSSKELNYFENKKNMTNLENSYENSLILLNIMQKYIEKKILEKYNIEKNNQKIIKNANNEVTTNILMKKKFLSNPL